jgi:putative solute:sodium symporter small subunit
MSKPLSPEQAAGYWRKTSRLMWTILFIWFVAGFVVHFFARDLNQLHVLRFPLGYYMAAQGSLIVFVVLCFWNAMKQDTIDREFDVEED